jgi:hypothetical protein
MATKQFIQAIKTGDFEQAQNLIQSYHLTISHADCNKIMRLINGAENYTLHRFTEFRPILVYMINKTKHEKEIDMESTYVDYAFIGVFQGDGPQIDRDYLVNLGQGKMKKICL